MKVDRSSIDGHPLGEVVFRILCPKGHFVGGMTHFAGADLVCVFRLANRDEFMINRPEPLLVAPVYYRIGTSDPGDALPRGIYRGWAPAELDLWCPKCHWAGSTWTDGLLQDARNGKATSRVHPGGEEQR